MIHRGGVPIVAPTPAKWIEYVVVMFPGSQRIVACRVGSWCRLVEFASIFLPSPPISRIGWACVSSGSSPTVNLHVITV